MHLTFEQRLLVPTHLGRHATIRTMILRARNAGIDVEHAHDGRLFTRQHLLTLSGTRQDIRSFVHSWAKYWRARHEGLTAEGLRLQRQQARQRTDAFLAALERKHTGEPHE